MQSEFVLISKEEFTSLLREVINEEIESQIGPLKAVIAIKQKDACGAVGITDDTARNKVVQGKVSPLQKDGSRLIYFELNALQHLRPRKLLRKK
ncbi:MAG TPA: hypothetical protein PLK77_14540 [Pyrinomonadaceae bacterium]|nr:hypothetical protein [Pyrinomonadaceae bacterium]